MRRFTVSSLFPRVDNLEEEEEKEESQLHVSFSTHHICNRVSWPKGGIVPFEITL